MFALLLPVKRQSHKLANKIQVFNHGVSARAPNFHVGYFISNTSYII